MTERPAPPRLALTQQEAAAALGVSVETFVRSALTGHDPLAGSQAMEAGKAMENQP